MRKYELVIVLNARIAEQEHAAAVKEVEGYLWDAVVQKDDIWTIDASYDMHRKKWNNKVYLISYLLEMDATKVAELKAQMKYTKWLERHFFYSMSNTDVYMTYAETQKKVAALLETQ